MRKILIAVSLAFCFSCTNEDRTIETLEAMGFTDIQVTGYSAFSCSKGDTSCTGFEATSPSGHRVEGAVGCGIGCGKGCTIRFN